MAEGDACVVDCNRSLHDRAVPFLAAADDDLPFEAIGASGCVVAGLYPVAWPSPGKLLVEQHPPMALGRGTPLVSQSGTPAAHPAGSYPSLPPPATEREASTAFVVTLKEHTQNTNITRVSQ